jgi:hypothetical protein
MKIKFLVVQSLVAVLCLCAFNPVWAYMDDIEVLEQKDIAKLTDPQLVDTYIDVIVEMEASKTFHTTSGFTPKQYTAYKDLLRYRIRLLMEAHKRGIEVPALDK